MISLSSVRKRHAHQLVFDSLSVSFNDNDRVALVGRNGAGKTSLLRLITGKEEPDAGEVSVSAGTTVGYLAQEVESVRDASAARNRARTVFAPVVLRRSRTRPPRSRRTAATTGT